MDFVSTSLGSHMTYPLPQPNTFSSFFETSRNLVLEKGFLAFWEAEHELKLFFFFDWLQKKDLLCMLQGIYFVCNPKSIRNQYRQKYFFFFSEINDSGFRHLDSGGRLISEA